MAESERELVKKILLLSNTDVRRCMQCGKCSASCPAGSEMDVQPHMFVWELLNGRAEKLLAAAAPWKCLSCFTCEARCPRGVSPAAIMEAVRLVQIRQQGGNRLEADKLTAQIDERMPQQALVAAFRKYNK